MWKQKLTKIEIAHQQLLHAIELFCSNSNLVSAITLAGVAEEILRSLVKETGRADSLETEAEDRCKVFQAVFDYKKDQKEICKEEHRIRNELKHLCSGNDIELDLEQETVDLIDRAIKNYQMLRPGFNSEFRAFDNKAAGWWRSRENQFLSQRPESS
jgi:hypothetical protein